MYHSVFIDSTSGPYWRANNNDLEGISLRSVYRCPTDHPGPPPPDYEDLHDGTQIPVGHQATMPNEVYGSHALVFKFLSDLYNAGYLSGPGMRPIMNDRTHNPIFMNELQVVAPSRFQGFRPRGPPRSVRPNLDQYPWNTNFKLAPMVPNTTPAYFYDIAAPTWDFDT